jgi:lipopolysaccharide biosynthesis glycosyltransferase
MDIVVASDENYAPHMTALICVACENNHDDMIETTEALR